MEGIVIARIILNDVLEDIKGLSHRLTEDELDDLTDELDEIYEKYKAKARD